MLVMHSLLLHVCVCKRCLFQAKKRLQRVLSEGNSIFMSKTDGGGKKKPTSQTNKKQQHTIKLTYIGLLVKVGYLTSVHLAD